MPLSFLFVLSTLSLSAAGKANDTPVKTKHTTATGWSFENQTRFIVLSTQRSGTHFTMAELRRHPLVYTFEELFYEHEEANDDLKFSLGLKMFFGFEPFKRGRLHKSASADRSVLRSVLVGTSTSTNHSRVASRTIELRAARSSSTAK